MVFPQATAETVIVVRPETTQGWDDSSFCSPSCVVGTQGFDLGPDPAPSGDGSLRFTSGTNHRNQRTLLTLAMNIPFREILKTSVWARSAPGTAVPVAVTLYYYDQASGSSGFAGYITTATDSWQKHDGFAAGATWQFSSGGQSSEPNTFANSTPSTAKLSGVTIAHAGTAPGSQVWVDILNYRVGVAANERTVDFEPADVDTDGTPDATDNCPTVSNFGQENFDGDSEGDTCDADDDDDTVDDDVDGCDRLAAATTSGCPAVARTLTLTLKVKRGVFSGDIGATDVACLHPVDVVAFKVTRGDAPDIELATIPTDATGHYSMKVTKGRGKYYTQVAETTVTDVATCSTATSPIKRIR
jgi:hypothetical protein